MSEINYEEAVKQVYPDAKELDNETDTLYASRCWISDGRGNDISDDYHHADSYRAWKDAYRRLHSHQ